MKEATVFHHLSKSNQLSLEIFFVVTIPVLSLAYFSNGCFSIKTH